MLYDIGERREFIYEHVWQLGDFLMWDNRCTIHARTDFPKEERNPVTHLRFNDDPADFQFAIVSDRTGGHRARIFSRAIEQLNLMQPEFVVSVGDLIEHPKFGRGAVVSIANQRMEVEFADGKHTLVHAR